MGNTYRFARQAPRARPRTPRPRLSRPGRKSCLFVRAGSWWSAKRKRRTRKARFRFGRRYRRRYCARRSGRIRKRRLPCHRRNHQCYRIACCFHPPPRLRPNPASSSPAASASSSARFCFRSSRTRRFSTCSTPGSAAGSVRSWTAQHACCARRQRTRHQETPRRRGYTAGPALRGRNPS